MLGVCWLMYPSFVRLTRHCFAQLRGGRACDTPPVHGFRTARPYLRLMLRVVGNVIDVARVFGNVSDGIFEVTEDVVAGPMPSRTPPGLKAVLSQGRYSHHDFIHARQEISNVIDRRMRRYIE